MPRVLPLKLTGFTRQDRQEDVVNAWVAYLEHTAPMAEKDPACRIKLDRDFCFRTLLDKVVRDGYVRSEARYVVSDWLSPAFVRETQRRAAGRVGILRRAGLELGPHWDPRP